jgi:hypothetical protein
MLTTDFYDIIDQKLFSIIKKYQDDEAILRHQNSETGQKAYAFLIWFLEFYGKTTNYLPYITDGDGDGSCDIIFNALDNRGNTVYYVVQSKWNTRKNALKKMDSQELGYTLNNFSTILRGHKKPTNNEALNQKQSELLAHVEKNGRVKFIFLSLCHENEAIFDNIQSFQAEFKQPVDLIGIHRIKRDYIEREYKQITPINPLEYHYDPEDTPITLSVERATGGDFIKIDKPFDAYIFLIKPKTIFSLFEQFGFSLFFKNVRNPISHSEINQQIEKTIIDNPAYFWYYNNGITAIADGLPEITPQAKQFELFGFQIINGAQTVYAIYEAYKNATPRKQAKMDEDVLITLRLLKSGGKDFDLQVTRYTNSQNPISDRDFHANDDVQIRLQNESFNTKIWYEKRQGEFRGKIPEYIEIVPNFEFANAYLAYELQAPEIAQKNVSGKGNQDLLFLSQKEHPNGLYERVFNDNTRFEDMLCSIYLSKLIMNIYNHKAFEEKTTAFYHLALFKIVFSKYVEQKYTHVPPLNQKILDLVKKEDLTLLLKVFQFITLKLTDFIPPKIVEKEIENSIIPETKPKPFLKPVESSGQDSVISEPNSFFKPISSDDLEDTRGFTEVSFLCQVSKSYYEMVKEYFEKMTISVEDIDNIKINTKPGR